MLSLYDKFKLVNDKPTKKDSLQKILSFIRVVFIKLITPVITVTLLSLLKYLLLKIYKIEQYPYEIYLLLIIFHSWIGGPVSGFLATFLSAIIGTLLFDPNSFSSRFSNHQQLYHLTIFIALSTTLITLSYALRKIILQLKDLTIKLRYSEKKLRDIIDSVYTIILITNNEGDVIEANKTFVKANNTKWSQLIGKKIYDSYSCSYDIEVKNKLKDSILNAKLNEKISYDEVLRVGKEEFLNISLDIIGVKEKRLSNIDKSFFYMKFLKKFIKIPQFYNIKDNFITIDNDDKKPDFVIISGVDVTERVKYQKSLERIKLNYEKLIDSNIIGMATGNFKEGITEVNNTILKMIGYSIDQAEEIKNWNQVTGEEVFTAKALKNGFSGPNQMDFIHKDGHRVPVLVGCITVDEFRGDCLALVLDLSSQKELENKKDEFISIASHELKTPLTVLKGYTQYLNKSIKQKFDENSRILDIMDRQVLTLTDLINELLDISKIQSGKLMLNKMEFNIVELITKIVDEISQTNKECNLKIKTYTDSIIVNADSLRISQVVINFITNAIKYSPSSKDINVYISEDTSSVRVDVEDFGIGIDEDQVKRIFEKFFQVDEGQNVSNKSLGLGLYISSEIIKQHVGKIGVDSKKGKGSTFYFIISK